MNSTWIPALLAALGCALLGVHGARMLDARVALIAAWQRALSHMASLLGYGALPLEALLAQTGQLSHGDVADYFRMAAQAMREAPLLRPPAAGPAPGSHPAWQSLRAQERAVLIALLEQVGTCAAEQQQALLTGAQAALSQAYGEASQHAATNRRLYFALGTLGGLALFLWLI